MPVAGGYEYTGKGASKAGAGRGFVNPQRTDESDDDYITPAQRMSMEGQRNEERDRAKADKAYERSRTTPYASGGMTASARADGCAQRGKTRGKMV